MYRSNYCPEAATMGAERLHALAVMENVLDEEIERLENEYEWETRKYVYLQALECQPGHLQELTLRMHRCRSVISLYKTMLEDTFIQKLICMAFVENQQQRKNLRNEQQSQFSHPHQQSSRSQQQEMSHTTRQVQQQFHHRGNRQWTPLSLKRLKCQSSRSEVVFWDKKQSLKSRRRQSKYKTLKGCWPSPQRQYSVISSCDVCGHGCSRYGRSCKNIHIGHLCKHYKKRCAYDQHSSLLTNFSKPWTNCSSATCLSSVRALPSGRHQPIDAEHSGQRTESRQILRLEEEEEVQAVSNSSLLCFSSEMVQGFLEDESRT